MLTLPMCPYMLSTFSIKTLSIIIMVLKITGSIIPTLVAYLALVPMLVLPPHTTFVFSMPCNFLLRGRHDVPGKRSYK